MAFTLSSDIGKLIGKYDIIAVIILSIPAIDKYLQVCKHSPVSLK